MYNLMYSLTHLHHASPSKLYYNTADMNPTHDLFFSPEIYFLVYALHTTNTAIHQTTHYMGQKVYEALENTQFSRSTESSDSVTNNNGEVK